MDLLELLVRKAGEKEWEEFPELTCAIPRNKTVVCKVSYNNITSLESRQVMTENTRFSL